MTTIDKAQLAWITQLCDEQSNDDRKAWNTITMPDDAPKAIAEKYEGWTCHVEYQVNEGDTPDTVQINFEPFFTSPDGDENADYLSEDYQALCPVFFEQWYNLAYGFIEELAPLFGFEWKLRQPGDLLSLDPNLSAPLKVKDTYNGCKPNLYA